MINAELTVVIDHIIGVSLSKPHSNIQNGMVAHVDITMVKMRLQHTSTVWYGGSCTNQHDKTYGCFQKHSASFRNVPY